MNSSIEETSKRLSLASMQTDMFRKNSLGIILVGSVAYSPNFNVSAKSDLDMLIVVEDLKGSLHHFVSDENERSALKNRFFDGYSVKKEENGISLSIHVLSNDAFDIISKCFVADIRVYRPKPKDEVYKLFGFEQNVYDYRIKNIPLFDLQGVRTIVPISFIYQDRYYLGIHRDKLLSNPIVLHQEGKFVDRKLEKLWSIIAQNLCDESKRLYGFVDANKMSIINMLAKRNRMSQSVIDSINDKQEFYVSKFK